MKKGFVLLMAATLILLPVIGAVTFFGRRNVTLSQEAPGFVPYARLPLSFEKNLGQADGQVRFLSRAAGYSLYLSSTAATLALGSPPAGGSQNAPPVALEMKLVGSNPAASMIGLDQLPGKVNYFIGDDPSKWQTNIPTYRKIRYQGVYPGIDLVYYGNRDSLEYDFIVSPGSDPSVIAFGFKGAGKLKLDRRGDLLLGLENGEIRMERPFIYQEVNGARQAVSGGYSLSKDRQVGFAIEAYDPSKPLLIDPVLVYSTYFGGFNDDDGMGIAMDQSGNMYFAGPTNSTVFPIYNPLQATYAGGSRDGFVVKLDPTGSTVLYSTYFGGSAEDTTVQVVVDSSGNAFIAGYTRSTNFPTTQNPLQATNGGGADVYVAKLSPDGDQLLYSTYLGGNGDDLCSDIGLVSADYAVISGQTQSTNFPVANAIQADKAGAADAFLAKLDTTNSTLIYSTYLGGLENDSGEGIAVDASGNTFLIGATLSTNFPTKKPLQAANAGPGLHDAFLTKTNPNGSLLFSTYLGGNNEESGNAVAVDSAGNAYLTGQTYSSNFPVHHAAQPTLHGSNDAFVAKVNSAGSALLYSTYLGGGKYENGRDVAVGMDGNVYVTGDTTSTDFPLVDSIQATFGGGDNPGDAFVTKLDPGGDSLSYSTYLGGNNSDRGRRMIVVSGVAYVTGLTQSTNFPIRTPLEQAPLQDSLRGASDAFIAILCAPRFTVTSAMDGGPGSLRQAVSHVCPEGTIDFNLPYPATITLEGELSRIDKNLTISGPGAGNLTVLGEEGADQIFYIYASRNVNISDLTISNAHVDGTGIENYGNLTITNVTFSNNENAGLINHAVAVISDSTFINNHNSFTWGGAIGNYEATLTVARSTFSGNAALDGGGIFNSGGAVTVENSTFSGNSATYSGAAITNFSNESYLTVENTVFSNNVSGTGGGAIRTDHLAEIIDTSFIGNRANVGGGVSGSGTITVRNSTFSENSANGEASSGGGIDFYAGMLNISNSTFYANSASRGGGVNSSGGTLSINNSTFSNNSASQFGGGINNEYGNTLNLSNNILANNTSDDCTNNGGSIETNANNLIENNAASPAHCGVPALTGDPVLGTLASNGGPTQTMALLAGSPAIDAGDNESCATTDQRGITRPIDGDKNGVATCDIGAFEYFPPSNLKSIGSQDGWLLESGESTNKGGSTNNTATAFLLGDDAQKKQYRSVLSFSTKGLPDNAVITRVTLKVKRQGVVGGGNPLNLFQGILVDIKKGFFGSAAGLQASDFQANANKSYGPFKPALSGGWYAIDLTPAKVYINKLDTNGGLTQIRLRFNLDDNNNAKTNYLKLFSGNAPAASRPQLIIEYYVP